MANYPRNIIIHHSKVSYEKNPDQHEAIDKYHKGKGWGMIGYHYTLSKDGKVKQGREENQTGAHCSQKLMNFRSIGICLSGDFDIEEPTQEQKLNLLNLIKKLQDKYRISDANVYPHRHFATYKSCWGSKLPDDILGYLENPNDETPDWAKDSMEWAEERGIMANKNPNNPVTRAELSLVIKRLNDHIK